MDSPYLLVVDSSPDQAQLIKSFLRNAGLAVRVANASSLSEYKQILKEHSPFLILVGAPRSASAFRRTLRLPENR